MGRPEHLFAVRQRDRLEWLPAGMAGGEGNMIRGVPILRHHHGLEFLGDVVDQGDDRIAMWHSKAAAGAKVILYIDDQQSGAILHGSTISKLRWRYRQGGPESCKAPPFKERGRLGDGSPGRLYRGPLAVAKGLRSQRWQRRLSVTSSCRSLQARRTRRRRSVRRSVSAA